MQACLDEVATLAVYHADVGKDELDIIREDKKDDEWLDVVTFIDISKSDRDNDTVRWLDRW